MGANAVVTRKIVEELDIQSALLSWLSICYEFHAASSCPLMHVVLMSADPGNPMPHLPASEIWLIKTT
jgi:hypothetical protein